VDDDRFEVADGNLKLKAGTTLDFESDTSPIEVTITASGAGESATHTVSVSINDVNEAPSISVADGTTPGGVAAASTIDENADGVPVGEITLSDPDAGDTHTLSVSDDRFETSQDDAGGWWLKLKDGMSLDHEEAGSVMVTVTVTDAGGLSASTDVTVTVNNVDEAPSAPMLRDAELSVDENDAGATLSSLADSTDPEGDAVSYSVDNDKFEITSGLILKLKDGMYLNYEDGASVDLVITASDPAGNSSMTTVTVSVGNVNEAPEVMADDHAVDENMAGVGLGAIMPSDPDGDTLTVEVSGDDRFESRQDDQGGWWVALKEGESLDYETEQLVDLMVTVTDAGGLSASTDVTVTVNNVNEGPMLTVGAPSTVGENVAGADVATVSATDPDMDDTHTYEVSDDRFEIADGMLKLKDGESLDYETDPSVDLTVTVTDAGGLSDSADVTVMVGVMNEAPELTVGAPSPVDENAEGADVASVSATDADAGDTHSYEVSDDRFEVAGGMLKLKDGMSLDYETETSVDLMVTVTDAGGLSDSADVTVMVNDLNEAPMADDMVEVADAVFVGGMMNSLDVDLKALFSDPDGDTLTYALSDNAPEWLSLSVTIAGSGDDQTITGTISGTPPAGTDIQANGVSIIASDGDGLQAQAMFDVFVDAENDAPTRIELRVTDDEGLIIRTTEVNVDENAMGTELGTLILRDPDFPQHPHGQHEYSFMVDDADDDRFEVVDGMLKLKDDASLDREEDGSQIELVVTATDMQVHAPAEGEDPTAESISLTITISIGDVDTGNTEGPRRTRDEDGELTEIGPVTITVDEDLDEDDVDAGDWLKTVPKGLSTAFEDPDGDDLTYSLGSGAPRWLEIDEDTGELTNKELMLPRRGVYEVTIVVEDEADPANSDSATIVIAVAISDTGDEDNDEPDIRNVDEIGYTEGDESGAVVATFEVRDDDIEIAPHPFGVHKVTFEAEQDPGDGTDAMDVTDAFKIVRVRDDGDDTAEYEIRAKTPDELAEGADGLAVLYGHAKTDDKDKEPDVYPKGHAKEGEVIPVNPIDYEEGDEIDFEITVTDKDGHSTGEADDRSLSIDVEDAPDESPMFQSSPTGGRRNAKEMTTTISVNQETEARTILVMRLDELWEDADTDDDDLTFGVDGTSGLPDWIKVYGPDRWEDIYENRRNDFTDEEVDAVEGVRDRDEVVVIVMDRSADDGENVDRDSVSFTISADDGDNDPVTETIMISVTNINVNPADPTKVVSISGGDPNKDKEVTGTGDLTMNVNFDLDPDLKGGESPYLVLYTWSVTTDVADDGDATNGDETVEIISVSTTNDPLPLGEENDEGMMTRIEAYVDQTIMAKVEIFEFDPGNKGKVTMAQVYMAEVEVASAADAPVTPPAPTTVSFGDITTDTTGVVVTITATGEAAEAGTARLQSSTSGNDPKGTSGWISVDSAAADTSSASVQVTLDVDANGDGTTTGGDGGGLYYRVVYEFEDEDGEDGVGYSDVIRLGDVSTDPADIGLIAPTTPASGDTLRVNNLEATVDVQWQAGMDTDESGTIEADEWMDLAGETGMTLTLTDDHAGYSVRALLTHKGDEDNPSHVTWVDYTTPVATVAALSTSPNNPADRTQATYWIEVNLHSDNDDGTGTGDVSGFFFDSDGDDLTYSLVGDSVDDNPAGGIQDGNTVFRSGNDDQILTLNKNTGAITYYTNNGMSHDNDAADTDADGAGNWFTVTVQASDGKPDPDETATGIADTSDDLTVNVRVNVAPSAINVGGSAIEDDADETPTASGITFAETAEYDGTDTAAIDVQDLNLNTHSYGTHTVTVMRKDKDGKFVADDRFELERTDGDDMSLWTLSIKDDAEFDYEHADNPMGVITLKVTATDGGGKSTVGYISVTLTDVDDGDDSNGTGNEDLTDPQYEAPDSSGAGNGGIMTTGGGAGGDDDGAGNASGDGGIWVESDFMEVDIFESYMLIIDDIDVA